MSGGTEPWLVAIDIDGTLISDYGELNPWTITEIQRLDRAGHRVTIATGRSVPMTLPLVKKLGIAPEYLVCANGAIVVRRDESDPTNYVRDTVELFNDLLLQ